MNGVHFALRGGAEHRNLRMSINPQLSLGGDSDGREFLVYREDRSKTNQGGLLHLRVKPKVVRAYENLHEPSRCIVNLYKKYCSVCPRSDKDAFYKQELKVPNGDVWFSKQAKGVHSLRSMVSDMCKEAGITGHRTNQSLRATAASRLYQNGVDEQLIQEVTGHRSSAVRSYKRTADDQRREISAILGGAKAETQDCKKQCVDSQRVGKDVTITINLNL